ncbi:MAG: Uma2 family endonuclease [Methanosarcinaceae archaeon]
MKIKDAVAAYPAETKTYTYQDYLDLPEDGKRYELIHGELIMAAAPYMVHQAVSRNIAFELEAYVRKTQAGLIYYAPVDVVFSDTNVVQPDILFIANENKHIITEKNIAGAPDLIIEILSPNTAYYDMLEKKELYAVHNVQEYWIVDPKKHWVEVYSNREGKFERDQRVEKEGIVKSRILTGWEIRLESVFTFI